jgi:hypothetical protein
MKLSLFLIGALAAVAQGANAAMDAEEASEKRQQDEYERNLQDVPKFIQTYSVVTRNNDIIFVTPNPLLQFATPNGFGSEPLNGRSSLNLLGSKIVTFGKVLKPTTVVLIKTDTKDVDEFNLFAGGLQPNDDNPSGNSNFFLAGSCTTISQLDDERSENTDDANPIGLKYLPTIKSHQCLYDLCLGGKGYNCLTLYGGGGFIFNPVNRISLGIADDDNNPLGAPDASIITDNNRQPPLPPAFELVVLGGTGSFRLVSGRAELITVAGRTRGNPLNGVPQKGVIVQNLITITNIPLPEAKS